MNRIATPQRSRGPGFGKDRFAAMRQTGDGVRPVIDHPVVSGALSFSALVAGLQTDHRALAGDLPNVESGTLVANFVCDPETMDLGPQSTLQAWRAANDDRLVLVAEGAPESNIVFDPDELGGLGSLVVNDRSGENRRLEGSLGGVSLANATIFWVGYFSPGRDGSLGDASGQYVYSLGIDGPEGSQLDNQIDDGRFEIYGGDGTQVGRDITYLNGHYSVWMSRFHAGPTVIGHESETNGFDLLVPTTPTGYLAGDDHLVVFAYQNGSGNGSSGYNFVGNLHQLVVYEGLLDDNDTTAVNNHLRSKLLKEPPGPDPDAELVTRVVSITGLNDSSDTTPDIYFPHGDPRILGEATFVLNPNNSTMDWSIELRDDRYAVTQAHMYSPHHKPNGDSIFCWGGRWSDHDFLAGGGFSLSAHHLQEIIDTPSMWTLVLHTEGGHFALDEAGDLVPYDASIHEISVSGQVESGGRYNNRVPRRLDDRRLREQNPHSGHFGDPAFDAVYPDRDHFLREHATPFPDADGNQWIRFDPRNRRWVPSEYGASRGLTDQAIDRNQYLFYRYDDQGPSWDYGGPEGAGGGVLEMPIACPSDFNGDGVVDGLDFGVLLSRWGTSNRACDLDGDGVVAAEDLLMLLQDWGECPW